MFNELMTEIVNLRMFIIVYLIILVALVIVWYMFVRDFHFSEKNVKIFSLLFDLSARQKVAIALAISRYLFVVLSVIFWRTINVGNFIVLMIMTLAIMVLSKDALSIVTGILNYTAVYAITYLEYVLMNFYNTVEHYWLVLLMAILLGVFTALYATYHFIYTYNRIIRKEPVKDKKWHITKPKLKLK